MFLGLREWNFLLRAYWLVGPSEMFESQTIVPHRELAVSAKTPRRSSLQLEK
jgi:hypothetical protein